MSIVQSHNDLHPKEAEFDKLVAKKGNSNKKVVTKPNFIIGLPNDKFSLKNTESHSRNLRMSPNKSGSMTSTKERKSGRSSTRYENEKPSEEFIKPKMSVTKKKRKEKS